jgi:hypothetical protein
MGLQKSKIAATFSMIEQLDTDINVHCCPHPPEVALSLTTATALHAGIFADY